MISQDLCISNNLRVKLLSSLESLVIFDERFKVTLVSFFIADLNLLICELDILHLTCYIESFLY